MKEAIDYCIDNDILKEFLKTYRSEVTKSMQLNYEFDRQLELERADAIEEGMEIGIEKGIEKGEKKRNKEIALNLLTYNTPIDVIAKSTGLSIEEIKNLEQYN